MDDHRMWVDPEDDGDYPIDDYYWEIQEIEFSDDARYLDEETSDDD